MRFPKIQSPCPYRDSLDAIMDGDMCRMCERNVFDLTAMTDEDRSVFLSSCTGEICVSFNLPVRQTVAAAAITAATLLAPQMATAQSTDSIYCSTDMSEYVIIVGGLRSGVKAQMIEYDPNDPLPNLPVMSAEQSPSDIISQMFGMTETALIKDEDEVTPDVGETPEEPQT